MLQRLRSELASFLPSTQSSPVDYDDKHWVSALTAGFTHWTHLHAGPDAGVGSAVTIDALPDAWANAYGHRYPVTARLILQLRGNRRWQR